MAYKEKSPIIVAEGGTGAATLTGVLTGNGTSAVTANTVTQHGVLLGGASNAVSSLGVAASSTVLQGSTGADPSFTATPTVTSITLGSGSALSTFNDWNTFTPTAVGRSTAGATTYVTQAGFYMRIGNLAVVQFTIIYSAATGTGDILIGALPFTINGAGSYQPTGACIVGGSGVTWPVGQTSLSIQGLAGTTTAVITCSGTASAQSNMQVANATTTIIGTLMYRI